MINELVVVRPLSSDGDQLDAKPAFVADNRNPRMEKRGYSSLGTKIKWSRETRSTFG